MPAGLAAADPESLRSLWPGRLEPAFRSYSDTGGRAAAEPVAMAAALVETALDLQELGRGEAGSGPLLLGDLCLARASRLLAEVADGGLQVAFARVVERVSAAAAAGEPFPPVRALLAEVVAGC